MSKTTDIFSTGQVAQICKVAPRTVSKWFDSGRLRGYRLPGSQDRRIPRENLIKFLKEHGMPLGALDGVTNNILFVGCDSSVVARVEQLTTGAFKVATAASAFEAGIEAETSCPVCVVIDFAIGRELSLQLASGIRTLKGCDKTVVIALLGNGEWLDRGNGFEDFFRKPLEPEILNARIGTLVSRQQQGD